MDGSELNTVVDNLAPIAEEAVRQVQVRALFIGMVCGVLALATVAASIVLSLRARRVYLARRDLDDALPWGLAVGGCWIIAIACIVVGIDEFGHYLAPLSCLLGN